MWSGLGRLTVAIAAVGAIDAKQFVIAVDRYAAGIIYDRRRHLNNML